MLILYTMKKLKIYLYLCFLGCFTGMFAQKHKIKLAEKQLITFVNTFSNNDTNSEVRIHAVTSFNNVLSDIIKNNSAVNRYKFKKLKKTGVFFTFKPNNKSFRLYNWYTFTDSSYKYTCLVKLRKHKSTITLNAISKEFQSNKKAEKTQLNNNNWYEAFYYKIIENKDIKGKYFTLLGINWNSNYTTKKVIDNMYISQNSVNFNLPYLMNETHSSYRRIFEYKKDAKISVNYYKKERKIIFDHLAPIIPNFTENYTNYVPTGALNSYKFENKRWQLILDDKFGIGK